MTSFVAADRDGALAQWRRLRRPSAPAPGQVLPHASDRPPAPTRFYIPTRLYARPARGLPMRGQEGTGRIARPPRAGAGYRAATILRTPDRRAARRPSSEFSPHACFRDGVCLREVVARQHGCRRNWHGRRTAAQAVAASRCRWATKPFGRLASKAVSASALIVSSSSMRSPPPPSA